MAHLAIFQNQVVWVCGLGCVEVFVGFGFRV